MADKIMSRGYPPYSSLRYKIYYENLMEIIDFVWKKLC